MNGEVGFFSDAGDGGGSAAPPQSIASQLDALAVQEDLLLQQYQVDMRHLDEVIAPRRVGGVTGGYISEPGGRV